MPLPSMKHQHIENTLITCSKVWYKYGSVVLQAESTQFRVHWGVLSQHSDTPAADLEGLPQLNNQPTVDRCHIIELQDPVIDVEYLLKVPRRCCTPRTNTPFPARHAGADLGYIDSF
jgi:hypothetical protein